MMKTKLKDQNLPNQEIAKNPEIQQQQQNGDDHQQQPLQAHIQPQNQPLLPLPPQEQHQQSVLQANNNKRKAMEQQGISPDTDRTRPRFNDIATVV